MTKCNFQKPRDVAQRPITHPPSCRLCLDLIGFGCASWQQLVTSLLSEYKSQAPPGKVFLTRLVSLSTFRRWFNSRRSSSSRSPRQNILDSLFRVSAYATFFRPAACSPFASSLARYFEQTCNWRSGRRSISCSRRNEDCRISLASVNEMQLKFPVPLGISE
jgi:hypothetical protein